MTESQNARGFDEEDCRRVIDPVTQLELLVPHEISDDRAIEQARKQRAGELRVIRFFLDWGHNYPGLVVQAAALLGSRCAWHRGGAVGRRVAPRRGVHGCADAAHGRDHGNPPDRRRARLFVEVTAVKYHVQSILSKTGSRDRLNATLWGLRHRVG